MTYITAGNTRHQPDRDNSSYNTVQNYNRHIVSVKAEYSRLCGWRSVKADWYGTFPVLHTHDFFRDDSVSKCHLFDKGGIH